MTTEQLSMSMFASRADYDAAVRAQAEDEHAQRVTLQHHACDLAQRVADLEAERAAMREKHDELLVALHGIGKALGIPEGDRSPYSVMCGTLERVNRLAEIEAQEPVMYVLRRTAKHPQPAVVTQKKYLSCAISDLVDMGLEHLDPLFSRPVPAQAVPTGGRQAVLLTDERLDALADEVFDLIQDAPDDDVGDRTWDRMFGLSVQSAVLAANNLEVRRG